VCCTAEVWSPFLKCFDNCEKLLVVNRVVESWPFELLGEERNWVKLAVLISLAKLSSDCEVRGVSFDFERYTWIRQYKYRIGDDCFADPLESLLMLLFPLECSVLLGKFV
jgi:hypothetical protein